MSKIDQWPAAAALFAAFSLFAACGGGESGSTAADRYKVPASEGTSEASTTADNAGAASKPGMITDADLALGDIDKAMVEKGKTTYDVKCQACHSVGENRVVGPGWKGITTKRQPSWIMNMIMNIDVMLAEDPEAQKLLEECLVRMPNQNLSKDEAREVLEFMRTL
jgi:mono/diheme cytochrome c family protein